MHSHVREIQIFAPDLPAIIANCLVSMLLYFLYKQEKKKVTFLRWFTDLFLAAANKIQAVKHLEDIKLGTNV